MSTSKVSLADASIVEERIACNVHGRKFSCFDGTEKKFNTCLKEFSLIIQENKIFINLDILNQLEVMKEGIAKNRTVKDLPSPKGKLLVGHLTEFKKENKHQIIEDWVAECGDLFRISLMGKKFVVSANHEFNLEILKSRPNKFRRFSKIAEIMEEMGIYGVFGAEGESWENQRRITAEALSLKNIKGFFPTLAKMTERLMHRWVKCANEGTIMDVQKEMMLYTVDVTTSIAFGYDTNTLEKGSDDIQNHLEKIFPMVNKRISSPFPMWRLLKNKEDKELDNSLIQLQKTVNQFIDIAKEKLEKNPKLKETPSNFLEALLVEQEKSERFSDKEIFGNVFTMLLAGEDTTSNSISWALYYLALHPEIVKKVRDEGDKVFKNENFPSLYDQMNQLKYTESVCSETIRMKPVTPTLIMQANEDIAIKGLSMKKGTSILMQNKVVQTDEAHFVKANEFLPERWNTGGCPVHGAHKPETIKTFGAGARFCPGKYLAIQEMKMAIAMICTNFDLKFAIDPKEVREVFAFTMYPKNLLFKLTSRKR